MKLFEIKSCGIIFLHDDGHAVVPLQKLPCILFIRGIAAVRRAAAVDGNFRYSQVIPDLELLPEGYVELASLYEDEIRESIDDAAEFELYTQTHSSAPSTVAEFQRIWNNFERFLRSNPALSIFLDDDGHAVVPLQKLPCVLFIRGIAAVRRAAAVDGYFRYLEPGSINNAVAGML